jgi:hydrogenase nickel incorporation protein HypA/HybF
MLIVNPRFRCYECACPNLGKRGFFMHELAIAESLLEIVVEEGLRHDLERIRIIRLQIGAMANVIPEALTFSFEMVSQNTIASGAVLEIETVPLVAQCSECGQRFDVVDQVFLCTRCGKPDIKLVSGRELSLVNLEGETRDSDG